MIVNRQNGGHASDTGAHHTLCVCRPWQVSRKTESKFENGFKRKDRKWKATGERWRQIPCCWRWRTGWWRQVNSQTHIITARIHTHTPNSYMNGKCFEYCAGLFFDYQTRYFQKKLNWRKMIWSVLVSRFPLFFAHNIVFTWPCVCPCQSAADCFRIIRICLHHICFFVMFASNAHPVLPCPHVCLSDRHVCVWGWLLCVFVCMCVSTDTVCMWFLKIRPTNLHSWPTRMLVQESLVWKHFSVLSSGVFFIARNVALFSRAHVFLVVIRSSSNHVTRHGCVLFIKRTSTRTVSRPSSWSPSFKMVRHLTVCAGV